VYASGEIGRRSHPTTCRTIIYIACSATAETEPAAAAAREVAEARWVTLHELNQLMPDLYEPAREHLTAILGR
jgi:NADH pyrophosphatase NudC (nudix superfamily)